MEITTTATAAFTSRLWHSLTMYECSVCPFNTLDLTAMIDHQEIVHEVPMVKVAAPEIVSYDRFGHIVEEGKPSAGLSIDPQSPEVLFDRFGYIVKPNQPTPYVPKIDPAEPRYDRFGILVENAAPIAEVTTEDTETVETLKPEVTTESVPISTEDIETVETTPAVPSPEVVREDSDDAAIEKKYGTGSV